MALVKYNNNSISSVTALDSIASGSLVLLTTNTITSGVSSSSFTSNIDSTYDTYIFKFINIHPATDSVQFQFNLSTDGGSNYNVTKTTTSFGDSHREDDAYAFLGYGTGSDLAQSTSDQIFSWGGTTVGNGADENMCGELYLFSPSSTTYVKHFLSVSQMNSSDNYSHRTFTAGYANTVSACNAVIFRMSSGNIDSGVIKMYGLSKS